jgi:hypothetical protein
MTSQNPASPNSQNSQRERDILAKVNAHADRSLDRLFADIDELLGDDVSERHNSAAIDRQLPQQNGYSQEPVASDYRPQQPPQQPPIYPPASDFSSSKTTDESQPPRTAKPKRQQRNMPLWMKVFLGIGATSIALSGLLLWLINERKIELPKSLDTTWLPFQSRSQISPEDAKFADYMRKSIANIEAAKAKPTTATTLPSSNDSVFTATPAAPIVATAATPATPTTPQVPIALVQTLPTNANPGAIFKVNNQSQTVHVGQKIGTSKWSLLTVAKGEVIVKKVGGEIRSIYVGQTF